MALKHRFLTVGAVVLALSLLLSLSPVIAAVDLVYFRAAAQADNTILVTWATATERDVTGFRLYRSELAAPADWGSPITDPFPAQGNAVTGADYQFVDAAVTFGVKYYYLLREVNANGTADHGPISQGLGLATDTPTPSPTTAVAATATWTRVPTSTRITTATLLPPGPTATRRFTETPSSGPAATATRPGAATSAAPGSAAPTPLPAASVATPTGQAPRATIPPVQSTVEATPVSPLPSPTLSPTFAVVTAPAASVIETATPRPAREVTPVIFAAETATAPGTPQAGAQAARQPGRSTSLALVIGGSAIGLAALLVAVLLFLRSRRS